MRDNSLTLPAANSGWDGPPTAHVYRSLFEPEETPAVDWIKGRESSLETDYDMELRPNSREASVAVQVAIYNPPSALDSLRQTMVETYSLQSLCAGWNGYDAIAPSSAVVRRALEWLQNFYTACVEVGQPWHRPSVTASAEGEVVYEWWADDRTLTVYAEAEAVEYLKFGRGAGNALREHGSAEDSGVCVDLMRWFGE